MFTTLGAAFLTMGAKLVPSRASRLTAVAETVMFGRVSLPHKRQVKKADHEQCARDGRNKSGKRLEERFHNFGKMDTEAAQMFKARYQFVWFCDWSFWTSSGLSVSIFAPFFISSADGTLMMSLVSGGGRRRRAAWLLRRAVRPQKSGWSSAECPVFPARHRQAPKG